MAPQQILQANCAWQHVRLIRSGRQREPEMQNTLQSTSRGILLTGRPISQVSKWVIPLAI